MTRVRFGSSCVSTSFLLVAIVDLTLPPREIDEIDEIDEVNVAN
jgi:hypothetical protein